MTEAEAGCKEIVVDTRADAEEHNTQGTNNQCHTGIKVGCKGGQRSIGLLDVHSLNDKQIVVE